MLKVLSLSSRNFVVIAQAPLGQVKSVQTIESCLAGVQKVLLGAEGPRAYQKSLALGQTRFAPMQPHVVPVQQAMS